MIRCFTLIALLAAPLAAPAADWLQFRGPRGSGVTEARGLPVTWSNKENVVWRTALPGPGTSSPIVVGKRIYLTCYTGYGIDPRPSGKKSDSKSDQKSDSKEDMDKLRRHLLCIDRPTGTILWTKDFEPELPESNYVGGNNTQHGYSSSTLASDGKRLFAFFGKSGVYALDLDGKELWRVKVGDGTKGWGSSNSPVLYQGLVFINASIESSSLVALDQQTGQEKWRVKDIRSSWNTPVLVEAPDGAELVLSEARAVIGFDPASGKELWRVGGFSGYVCPSVVTEKGIVYVVRGEALAIKAGGRGDVTDSHVVWRGKGSSLVSSPVVYDGKLFYSGGNAIWLDAATGKEIQRSRLGGSFYASPLVADGKIYCTSRFGGTYVLEAGGKFAQLAHNRFEDDESRTNAGPIVSDGRLLLRTDRFLYCLAAKE